MIRRLFLFLVTVLVCVTITFTLSEWLLQAAGPGGSTITVMATVRPQRIIVVDKQLAITRILSNTARETRPIVLLNSVDGKEMPYSESIVDQYASLKPSLDFSKPGIVYERREAGVLRWLKKLMPAT